MFTEINKDQDSNNYTYTVSTLCTNCIEWRLSIIIQKGTKIVDHPCPTCGCKTLTLSTEK